VKKIVRIVALSLGLLLLAPDVGQAHVMSWETNLTLRANDRTVTRGTVVKFTARLSSAKRTCYVNRVVRLQRNGVTVDSDRTNQFGKAVFRRTVNSTANYRAVFRGFRFGRHPHSHTCLASTSNTVTVTVFNS